MVNKIRGPSNYNNYCALFSNHPKWELNNINSITTTRIINPLKNYYLLW